MLRQKLNDRLIRGHLSDYSCKTRFGGYGYASAAHKLNVVRKLGGRQERLHQSILLASFSFRGRYETFLIFFEVQSQGIYFYMLLSLQFHCEFEPLNSSWFCKFLCIIVLVLWYQNDDVGIHSP